METEDAQQDPATVTSRAVTIGVWLVVMLVGYMASSGPAIWLRLKFDVPDSLLVAVYSPIVFLYQIDEGSWFGQSWESWVKWWAGLA